MAAESGESGRSVQGPDSGLAVVRGGCMDVRTHEDVAAAAAAHNELGHEYDDVLAEGLIERISSEIDKQVDARLAQRGIQSAIQPSRAAWANVAMGLGSVGLGIGATAVTLHSLSATGTVPKAVVNLGPFHASVMSSTTSISTAQVVLVVLIWVVIAVVNIAYARRRPRRDEQDSPHCGSGRSRRHEPTGGGAGHRVAMPAAGSSLEAVHETRSVRPGDLFPERAVAYQAAQGKGQCRG